jgi:hypothetical protein
MFYSINAWEGERVFFFRVFYLTTFYLGISLLRFLGPLLRCVESTLTGRRMNGGCCFSLYFCSALSVLPRNDGEWAGVGWYLLARKDGKNMEGERGGTGFLSMRRGIFYTMVSKKGWVCLQVCLIPRKVLGVEG